jgi:pimeloyl-ACP methyl ester carboxylesterase
MTDCEKTLPKSVQEVLDQCEKDGKTDTPEYRAALNEFYKRYLCRLDPFPKELTETFKGAAKDKTVYLTMWGPSDFVCTGSLDTWTIVKDLKKVTPKTLPGGMLVINGYFDQAQDEAVLPYFKQPSAKVKWVEFALSAHFPHLEETEKFIKVLGAFFRGLIS